MRFDDRLATVLAQPISDASARAAAWRQLVDLLAQRPADADTPMSLRAYEALRAWRDFVPAAERRAIGAAFAGRNVSAALVSFFAEDNPAVAAPVIGQARLSDEDWLRLLPGFSPSARALMRHRRDLGAKVMRALDSLGPSDRIIAGTPRSAPVERPATAQAKTPSATMGETLQISDLVERIEAFRRGRTSKAESRPEISKTAAPAPEPIMAFRFETGWDGTILWTDCTPRGPIIGLSVSTMADERNHGVDGHAAGAFRRRAPFRDARLTVAVAGGAGGEWRISAVPFFDTVNGRFLGYRGTARRPRHDERAEHPPSGLYGSALPAESLRQLVHEIRTPLNAIIGFAEMIDHQMLGPASIAYRDRASDILSEAQRLLVAVDDLDTAARLDAHSLALEPRQVDGAGLLAALRADVAPLADQREVKLEAWITANLPPIAADPASVERMFSRLLSATVGLAAEGEHIAYSLGHDGSAPSRLRFEIDRPAVMRDRDERSMLDPGYSPDGDWPDAPVLGLGFSLRLVRNLAEAAGGRLFIEQDRFVLVLPAAVDGTIEVEEKA